MDTFDGLESTNACEWDAEAKRYRCPAPATKPRSWAGLGGNTTHSSVTQLLPTRPNQASAKPQAEIFINGETRRVPTGPKKATGIPQRNILMNGEAKPKGYTPHLNAQKQQHPDRRYERAGKEHAAGATKQWAKSNAPNTKRMQDELDREAMKAAEEKEYLGQSPHNIFLATGYYLWSVSSIALGDLLGEDLQLLDGLRKQFKVYIDYEESVSCIRLWSQNLQNVEDGISGIKAKIRHARAEAASLVPIYIVEPPSVAAMRCAVSPKFKNTHQADQQPMVEKILLSGSKLAAEEVPTWENERRSIISCNEDLFMKQLKKAFEELRALKSGMRMRVHFGHVQLLLYRKDFKDLAYSFQKFAKMMCESRTKAHFEKVIGDAPFTIKVLELMKGASRYFCPTDSRTSNLADVQPKHSLIILARGPSDEQVRVEADIDMVNDGVRGSKKSMWQIGATTYYQHYARKTRLTVSTLGFECNLDWCLEIVTNDMILKPPQAFRDLVANSLFGTSIDKFRVAYPSVALRVPPGVVVDKVLIRSVLQQTMKDTSYIVEISIYREWNDDVTKGEPTVNCGISLYNQDWDLLMGPDKGVTDDRNWDDRSLFPSDSNSVNGFSAFLARVRSVQLFLDHQD